MGVTRDYVGFVIRRSHHQSVPSDLQSDGYNYQGKIRGNTGDYKSPVTQFVIRRSPVTQIARPKYYACNSSDGQARYCFYCFTGRLILTGGAVGG